MATYEQAKWSERCKGSLLLNNLPLQNSSFAIRIAAIIIFSIIAA